jgi:hypothetical protein
MEVVLLLLLLAGAICFGLAAADRTFGKVNTLALGLLFWILVPLINAFQHLD